MYTINELASYIPLSSMTFVTIEEDFEPQAVTMFITRETRKNIERLGTRVPIEVRQAVLWENGIGISVILSKLGDLLYETWFTPPNENTIYSINKFVVQKNFYFCFFEDGIYETSSRIIGLPITDEARVTLKLILDNCRSTSKLSLEKINTARLKIEDKFETKQDLWDYLGYQIYGIENPLV